LRYEHIYPDVTLAFTKLHSILKNEGVAQVIRTFIWINLGSLFLMNR